MKNFIFLFSILNSHFSILNCFSQPDNINLSNTAAFEGEPYLAINPANQKNIVVAWMAFDFSTGFKVAIKIKSSFDGGQTWGNQFIQPHLGATWHSADVSMQFRKNGTLYLSYIDYSQNPDSGGVYVTQSSDGGINWASPIQAFNIFTDDPLKVPLDRPWLAVDNSGTNNDGMVYITTKPAPWIFPPNRPYLKTSSDSGQTWSAYRYVDTTGYFVGNSIAQPMAFPTVTADGALCMAYPSYDISQSPYPKFFLAKSYDRGASFQYYNLLINPVFVTDTNYKLGYHLVANPANANQLAFAFTGNQNGDPDIFVASTNNGGITWNAPVRVNDDPIGNGKAQDMVWASYSDSDLVICWRDRRNGAGTGFYQPSDAYCAISHDNGTTFQNNLRLSNTTAPFDSILIQAGNDFLSCELVDDTIYSAWGDVRTGTLNIFFAKTSVSTGTGAEITLINPEDAQPLVIFPNPASDKLFSSLMTSTISK